MNKVYVVTTYDGDEYEGCLRLDNVYSTEKRALARKTELLKKLPKEELKRRHRYFHVFIAEKDVL